MEDEITIDNQFRPRQTFLVGFVRRRDVLAFGIRRAQRREMRRPGLDDQAEFHEIEGMRHRAFGLAEPEQHIRIEQVPLRPRQGPRADFGTNGHQTFARQYLDRLAQQVPPDAEGGGEFRLHRQWPVAVIAAQHRGANRVDDLTKDRPRCFSFRHGRRLP